MEDKTLVSGFVIGLLVNIGYFMLIIGVIIALFSKTAGATIWLIGCGLVVWSIFKNLSEKEHKGFATLNIAIKAFVLLLMLIMLALVLATI